MYTIFPRSTASNTKHVTLSVSDLLLLSSVVLFCCPCSRALLLPEQKWHWDGCSVEVTSVIPPLSKRAGLVNRVVPKPKVQRYLGWAANRNLYVRKAGPKPCNSTGPRHLQTTTVGFLAELNRTISPGPPLKRSIDVSRLIPNSSPHALQASTSSVSPHAENSPTFLFLSLHAPGAARVPLS